MCFGHHDFYHAIVPSSRAPRRVQCVKCVSHSCPQREVFLEKLKKEKSSILTDEHYRSIS